MNDIKRPLVELPRAVINAVFRDVVANTGGVSIQGDFGLTGYILIPISLIQGHQGVGRRVIHDDTLGIRRFDIAQSVCAAIVNLKVPLSWNLESSRDFP